MKNNRIIILSSILMLSGCFGPKYTWVKEGVSSYGKEFIIDDSACTSESYKAAPVMRRIRNKVYNGCMLGKGWDKQPAQEQSLVDHLLKK